MSKTIRLEKFTANDFLYYFQLVSDATVMAMITERALPQDEAERLFAEILANNTLHPDFGNFKILDALSGDFIGLAKLEISSVECEEAELGYVVLPVYWGQGIASKAAQILVDSAYKQPTCRKLFAIIDPQNLPSRKILLKNGFVSKEFKDFDGLSGEVLELIF